MKMTITTILCVKLIQANRQYHSYTDTYNLSIQINNLHDLFTNPQTSVFNILLFAYAFAISFDSQNKHWGMYKKVSLWSLRKERTTDGKGDDILFQVTDIKSNWALNFNDCSFQFAVFYIHTFSWVCSAVVKLNGVPLSFLLIGPV